MRTLYYNIEFIKKNASESMGYMYSRSQGILKVEYDEQGIKNIEGVLNLDIIVSEIQEDKIILKYYVPNEKFNDFKLDVRIMLSLEEIEIPLNFQGSNHLAVINFRTISKISNPRVKEEYDTRLKQVIDIIKRV